MTSEKKPSKLRFTIRHKLFLISLSLLVIPWFGYQYVVDMNHYLLENQQQALLDQARVVAAVLNEHTELFDAHIQNNHELAKQHLYVRALKTPINLDGYSDDWLPYQERLQFLNEKTLIKHEGASSLSIAASYQLGTYDNHLYLLFQVKDDNIVYSQPGLTAKISDHMQIAISTPTGKIKHFLIATFAPGRVNVKALNTDGSINHHSTSPIEAEWQETVNGYNIELRIPLSEIGEHLGFTLADADDETQPKVVTIIGTLNKDRHAALSTLTVPSQTVESLLNRLSTSSSRTWVVDQTQRVIARTGDIINKKDHKPTDKNNTTIETGILSRFVLNLLLSRPSFDFKDDLSDASRLQGPAVLSALSGNAAARWRHSPDRKVTILTASHPVINARGKVVGAVAIEETNNSSLMVQNRAMEIVINLSLMAFVIAAVILFSFATRLTYRIRRLRNDTERAIAQDGRILSNITPTKSSDEIGDLSRSFSEIVSRLSHYNSYLETMSGKLSHELRTPITVLRSSIENLEAETYDSRNITYLERAKEGISRLNLIVTRMSEATRLEQTLQAEKKQRVDICLLVSRCIEGYRLAFPHTVFDWVCDKQPAYINGAPDLIAQMLDKLISNARDFATPGTPIVVAVHSNDFVNLTVKNQGPQLPPEIQANLFDSMISVRDKRSTEPHLGLGLYIVRLITDFHCGKAVARNTSTGVEFILKFPRHFLS